MDYKYLLVGDCGRNRSALTLKTIKDDSNGGQRRNFNGASLSATVECQRKFGGRTLLRRKENCVNRNVNFFWSAMTRIWFSDECAVLRLIKGHQTGLLVHMRLKSKSCLMIGYRSVIRTDFSAAAEPPTQIYNLIQL